MRRGLATSLVAGLAANVLVACARGPAAPSPLHADPVSVLPLPSDASQRLATSTVMTKPLRGVIRNTNAWSVFWTRVERDTSTGAMPPLPFVDFTREMLLVAGDGRRPSGHRIEIPGAASRGDTLFVLVRAWDEVTNPSGGMAAPVAVVRVPRAAGPVVFREEARASVGPKG